MSDPATRFALFEPATGRIVATVLCPEDELAEWAYNHSAEVGIVNAVAVTEALESEYRTLSRTHCVRRRGRSYGISARPFLPARESKTEILANGSDETVIVGLPRRCRFSIDQVEHETTDGRIEFSTTMPGDYEIAISHWPHLDWSVTIKAI